MESSTTTAPHSRETSIWQRWLHHPESLWLHRVLFQIHMMVGIVVGLYVLVMSVSGSIIVYRDLLESSGDPNSNLFRAVEWLVDLHGNLLAGNTGRRLNGVGAACLTLLCLTGIVIWWPGIRHWRRSLTVNSRSSFARITWDLHNVLGFWCLLILLVWGLSALSFSFPEMFNSLFDVLEPGSAGKPRFGDKALSLLSNLHFGRFDWFTQALWAALGLVPAVLAFTGVFMCCHRIFRRGGAPFPK